MSKKTCLGEENKKADCKKKVVFYLQFAFFMISNNSTFASNK